MTTIRDHYDRIISLPVLDEDQQDDACFRARDRAWAAVAGLFEELSETEKLTYEALATRIGRKRSQVHRWLDSSCNMTLQSVGLLAEGMDADFEIVLERRKLVQTNRCHPSESAAIAYRIGRSQVRQSDERVAVEDATTPSVKFKYELETHAD